MTKLILQLKLEGNFRKSLVIARLYTIIFVSIFEKGEKGVQLYIKISVNFMIVQAQAAHGISSVRLMS